MKRLLMLPLMALVALSGAANADLIKQSTAYNRTVLMTSSSDHISGAAGLTLAVKVSKNGGAFATITPTVTDLTGGRYNIALTSSHTDTLGAVDLTITATGADPSDTHDQVYSALDANAINNVTLAATQNFNHTGQVAKYAVTVAAGDNSDKSGYTLASAQNFANANTTTPAWYTAFPTDYQQRTSPVILPTVAPSGYGGGTGSVFDAFSQVKGTYAAGTWGAFLNTQLANAVPLPADVVNFLFATDRYQKQESATIGNYTRVPATQVMTFTMLNGKTFPATVSVDSQGRITGRVVGTPQ